MGQYCCCSNKHIHVGKNKVGPVLSYPKEYDKEHTDGPKGEHKNKASLREVNEKQETLQLQQHQYDKITQTVDNVKTDTDHNDRSKEENDYTETSTSVKECGTHSLTNEKFNICNKQLTSNRQEEICYTQPNISRLHDTSKNIVQTSQGEDSQTNKRKLRRRYHKRVVKPIDSQKDYTDDEAVELAHEMNRVTVLRTNEGRVYRSSKRKHAESVFIEDTPNPSDITGLWIKNSPCFRCAERLIKHFESCETKPEIFYGKIYQYHKKKNEKGLDDLRKEGFNIQPWESFQQQS